MKPARYASQRPSSCQARPAIAWGEADGGRAERGGRARRAGPRQKKDIQSILSKIRRFGIKQQKLHRERVIYLMMDVPRPSYFKGDKVNVSKKEIEKTLEKLSQELLWATFW